MKKCPFCSANIEDSARFCLYCMQSLTEKEQILPYKKKKPLRWMTVAAVVAVSLILVIVLLSKESPSGSEMLSSGPQLGSTPTSNQTESSDTPHAHNFSVANTSIEYQKEAATCTTPAVFYYSCTCGEIGSNTFSHGEPNAHTVVTDPGYPANCSTPGLTEGTHCSACNTVLLAQTPVPVTNHTFDNNQDDTCNVCNFVRVINCNHRETVSLSAIPATCIASGLTEGKKCALCEEILTAQTVLAPLGHTEVIDPAVEPTCTTGGLTEGKHCATCHTIFIAQSTIAAKGHTKVVDQAVAATCTTEGKTEGAHCSVCNTVLLAQTPVPVTNHTFDNERDESCNVCNYVRVVLCDHAETVKLSAVAPTCIASGLTEGKKCAFCEEILTTQTVLAPLGHTEVIDPAVEPTCITGGMTQGKHCSTCHAVLIAQVPVAAKGHTRVIDQAVAATCTAEGKTEGAHCSVCQVVFLYQQTTDPLGHSFDPEDAAAPCSRCGFVPHIHSFTEENPDAKYLKSAAECTTPARYYYSCVCGEKGDDYFFYGRGTGHTVVTEPGYPAGCTTPGLTDRVYCSVCNDGFEHHTEIAPKGHTFEPGDSLSNCLVCGYNGTVIVQAPDSLFFDDNTFRIDSCTYTIRPISEDRWRIFVTINCTNISSSRSFLSPDFSIHFRDSNGSWTGYTGINYNGGYMEPNESGTCSGSFSVPNYPNMYKLIIS